MSSKHDPAGCIADIIKDIERIKSYVSGVGQGISVVGTMLCWGERDRSLTRLTTEQRTDVRNKLGERL